MYRVHKLIQFVPLLIRQEARLLVATGVIYVERHGCLEVAITSLVCFGVGFVVVAHGSKWKAQGRGLWPWM